MASVLSFPYARQQPGHVILVVLTVALGVSTIVASGSLIESAMASVEGTWESLSEFSDLRVANGFAGVPESLIDQVRSIEGVDSADALVTASAEASIGGQSFELFVLGMDLLGTGLARQSTLDINEIEEIDSAAFLTDPTSVALSKDFAAVNSLSLNDRFGIRVGGRQQSMRVAGLFPPNKSSAMFGGSVAVMDLPASQLLLNRLGLVNSIEINVTSNADVDVVEARIRELVGDHATIQAPGRGSPEWRSMAFNLRLILGLTGAVSLVIGGFVIFHAVSMSISRRKPQLDVVRSLGMSTRSLIVLLASEGLVMGSLGALIGVVLGGTLAWLARAFFNQSISALYTSLGEAAFRISPGYAAAAILLGIGTSLLACVVPARKGLRATSALMVTTPSQERMSSARRLAVVGGCLLAGGLALPMFLRAGQEAETIINLVISADALALIGIGLLSPMFLVLLSPVADRILRSEKLILLRLAWQGLISDPARSGAVFTAILLGSAYVIYTIAAVGSLRSGVLNWMVTTQEADIIVSGSGSIGVFPSSPTIPGDLARAFEAIEGVAQVEALRLVAQPYEDRWLVVASRNPAIFGERQPALLVSGDLAKARVGMADGSTVIASQHLAIKHGLLVGDSIKLRTPDGLAQFEIGAIVDDYTGGDLGTVFVAEADFKRRWRDNESTAFHIWTDEGANPTVVAAEVRSIAATRCDCSTITNAELHSKMGNILDSIFYSAYAMELVAILVMIAAIASFFTIALGEREQELATIQSLGATRRQLITSFISEALIMGAVGSALGLFGGLLLSARFVNTAMQIGAGLKFEFEIPYTAVAATFVVAMATSLAASLRPILRALRPNAIRDLDV